MTLTGQTSLGEITTPRPRSNVMSFVVHQTPAGWRFSRKELEHHIAGDMALKNGR